MKTNHIQVGISAYWDLLNRRLVDHRHHYQNSEISFRQKEITINYETKNMTCTL